MPAMIPVVGKKIYNSFSPILPFKQVLKLKNNFSSMIDTL
jgi:hypothetical protein